MQGEREGHTLECRLNFLDWPGGHAPTDRTIKGLHITCVSVVFHFSRHAIRLATKQKNTFVD